MFDDLKALIIFTESARIATLRGKINKRSVFDAVPLEGEL
jgi:hypothetical protein